MFKLHENFKNEIIVRENNNFIILLQKITECPWLILIPKLLNIKNILDLNKSQYILFNDYIYKISLIVNNIYKPNQINIATIGNITPQFHCHIIARFESDKFWPNTIWGNNFTKISTEQALGKYSDLIKEITVQF